ncbi:MAG: hypothetical protein WDN04_28445 [Rhodospirillales bacterium]
MKATIFAVMATLLAAPALAQIESHEGIELQNQILELRQELQQLQQLQSQAGGQPMPAPVPPDSGNPPEAPPGANDAVAQLVVRVSALEEQMRTLQGRVDELANTQQRDHDDLAKQIGDLAFKLGQGGAQPGATPDAGAPPPDAAPPAGGMDLSTPPPPPPPKRTPRTIAPARQRRPGAPRLPRSRSRRPRRPCPRRRPPRRRRPLPAGQLPRRPAPV